MKRSSLSFFTALLASALLLPSCVRDVVLDAGENVQVAVECVMSNDSIQKLYLSFTKGVSREEAEPLTEAVPTLIDLTESKTVGQFVKGKEENLWTLDYSAVPEHHYRLEVQVPGYELIWAEDIMPRRIKVTTVDPRKIAPGKYASQFKGHIYKFDEDFSSSLWIHGIDMEFEDWLVRTGPIAGEIFTDLQNVDNFNVTGEKYVPEIKLIVESYGKFTGIHTIYPDLKGAMKHDRFLRVNGGRYDELFLLSCNFSIWKDHAYYARPMIFMSVSDAYDDYLKTALMMDKVKESSDMSTLYLRDNLPSNIHGGIGIFGGKVQWDLDCGWRITYVPVEEYSKYGIDPETHKYIED
ncbi:MAG: DUF4249 family protein [Bacteroidales bacterium]|nr:DUF4249 family protein [Bacteroidales bacterium]